MPHGGTAIGAETFGVAGRGHGPGDLAGAGPGRGVHHVERPGLEAQPACTSRSPARCRRRRRASTSRSPRGAQVAQPSHGQRAAEPAALVRRVHAHHVDLAERRRAVRRVVHLGPVEAGERRARIGPPTSSASRNPAGSNHGSPPGRAGRPASSRPARGGGRSPGVDPPARPSSSAPGEGAEPRRRPAAAASGSGASEPARRAHLPQLADRLKPSARGQRRAPPGGRRGPRPQRAAGTRRAVRGELPRRAAGRRPGDARSGSTTSSALAAGARLAASRWA